jgi:hypothetical protein
VQSRPDLELPKKNGAAALQFWQLPDFGNSGDLAQSALISENLRRMGFAFPISPRPASFA